MTEHPLMAAARRAVSHERDGNFFQAESLYRQLSKAQPPYPMGRYLNGCYQLLKGNYEAGWKEFQWRLMDEFYLKKGTTHLSRPLWEGDAQPDKTLLIHVDQGLGDAIMCLRYFPLVADRVGKVIFAGHKRLSRFYQSVDPRITVMEVGEAVPEFDIHIDLFSLAVIFDTRPGNIPLPPYIQAEDSLIEKWRGTLNSDLVNVGLSWRGSPANARDQEKSIPLDKLTPLIMIEGVQCYSLQVEDGTEEIEALPETASLIDLQQELSPDRNGFVETAALMTCLDVTISIDTSRAHLAGALGVELWVPCSYVPDWRWMILNDVTAKTYESAPWYPEAKTFRQQVRYDWSGPVSEMKEKLEQLVEAKS